MTKRGGGSAGPDEVLTFWLDEVGEDGWYEVSDARDDEVRRRFQNAWEKGGDGAYSLWLTYPTGTLAYIILMDQFPRNMFRGTARAFSTDKIAKAAATMAIGRGWDMAVDEPARQFFYLPLMHSENLVDQERGVRLIQTRMPLTGADNLVHARAHREVIRRFGRFPHRNAPLGRATHAAEAAYLDAGGYGATVREMQEEPADT